MQLSTRAPSKRFWIWAFVLFLASYFWTDRLFQPLNWDEVEFSAAARAQMEKGEPLFQVGMIPPEDLPSSPQAWIYQMPGKEGYQYGLWHSSYYVFLLSAVYKFLGVSSASTRVLNLFFYLLSFLLLLQIAKNLYADEEKRNRGWDFSLLLALFYFYIPFLLSFGLMIDLDNGVGSLGLLMALWSFVRFEEKVSVPKMCLIQAAIFALLYWSKEYFPIYWMGALGLYELLRGRWSRIAFHLLSLLMGTLFFALTWWGFCEWLRIPADYFLKFSFISRGQGGEGLGSLLSLYLQFGFWGAAGLVWRGILHMIALLGLPLLLLGGVLFVGRFRAWMRREFRRDDIVFALVLGVFIVAKILRPGLVSFKYEYPFYPLLCLLWARSFYTAYSVALAEKRNFQLFLLSSVAALVVVNFAIDDPFYDLQRRAYEWSQQQAILSSQIFSMILVFVFVWVFFNRHWVLREIAVLSLWVYSAAFNVGLHFKQLRYLSSVSWVANYGETGAQEVVNEVEAMIGPKTLLIARKDLGYLMSLRKNDSNFQWAQRVVLHQPSAWFLVDNVKDVVVIADRNMPAILSQVEFQSRFEFVKAVGSFQVFRSRVK